MTPPTWRALAARARRLGMHVSHGPHAAVVFRGAEGLADFASWVGRRADGIVLRTAIAAALEQLGKR